MSFTPTRASLSGNVLDPCGSRIDAIYKQLTFDDCQVTTNDKYASNADYHFDITDRQLWIGLVRSVHPHWIVTSPPYKLAAEVVPMLFQSTAIGIAIKTRITFLEPCLNRRGFLQANPPHIIIFMPRISYTNPHGNGHRDMVSLVWLVWQRDHRQSSWVNRRGTQVCFT